MNKPEGFKPIIPEGRSVAKPRRYYWLKTRRFIQFKTPTEGIIQSFKSIEALIPKKIALLLLIFFYLPEFLIVIGELIIKKI